MRPTPDVPVTARMTITERIEIYLTIDWEERTYKWGWRAISRWERWNRPHRERGSRDG